MVYSFRYKLYGYKWFSSATDSDMALTLARIVDGDNKVTSGTSGISMFYLETHLDPHTLNSIEITRLKNKMGTHQLPTAELLLDGTEATLISEPGNVLSDMPRQSSHDNKGDFALRSWHRLHCPHADGHQNAQCPGQCFLSAQDPSTCQVHDSKRKKF